MGDDGVETDEEALLPLSIHCSLDTDASETDPETKPSCCFFLIFRHLCPRKDALRGQRHGNKVLVQAGYGYRPWLWGEGTSRASCGGPRRATESREEESPANEVSRGHGAPDQGCLPHGRLLRHMYSVGFRYLPTQVPTWQDRDTY